MSFLQLCTALLSLFTMAQQALPQEVFTTTTELQEAIKRNTNVVLSDVTPLSADLYQAKAMVGTVSVKLHFPWPLAENGTVRMASNLNLTIPDFALFLNKFQSQVGTNLSRPLLNSVGIGTFGLSISDLEFTFEHKTLVKVKTDVRIPGWDAFDALKFSILRPKILIAVCLKPSRSLRIKATGNLVGYAFRHEASQGKSVPVEFTIPTQMSEALTMKAENSIVSIPYDYLREFLTVSQGLKLPGIASQALINMKVQELELSLSNGLINISDFKLTVVAASPWLMGGEFSLENITLKVNQSKVSLTVTAKLSNETLVLIVPTKRSQSGYTLRLNSLIELSNMELFTKHLLDKTLSGKSISLPNFDFANIYGFGLTGKLNNFEISFSGPLNSLIDISLTVDLTRAWKVFDNVPMVVHVSNISFFLSIKSLNGNSSVEASVTGFINIGNPAFISFPFQIEIPHKKQAVAVRLQTGKWFQIQFDNMFKIDGMFKLPKELHNVLSKVTATVNKLNIEFPSNLTSLPQVNSFSLSSNAVWNLNLVRVANLSILYENKKYFFTGILEFAGLKIRINFQWPPKLNLTVISLPKKIQMRNLVGFIGKMTQNFMSGRSSKLDLKRAGIDHIDDFSITKFEVTLAEDLFTLVDVSVEVGLPEFTWDLLDDFFNVKNVTIAINLKVGESISVLLGGVIVLADEIEIPIQMRVPNLAAQNLSVSLAESENVVKAKFRQIKGLIQSSLGVSLPDILDIFLPDINIRKLEVEFARQLSSMTITKLEAEFPKQWDIGGLGILHAKDLKLNMTDTFYFLSAVIGIGGVNIPVQFLPNGFSTPQFRLIKNFSISSLPTFIKSIFQQVVTHERQIPDGTLVGLDGALSFEIRKAEILFTTDLNGLVSLDMEILLPQDWSFFSNLFTIRSPSIELKVTDFSDVQVDYEIYISATIELRSDRKNVLFPLRLQVPSARNIPVNLVLTSPKEIKMSDISILPLVGNLIPKGLLSPIAEAIGPIRINKLSSNFTSGAPTTIKSVIMSAIVLRDWKIPGLPLTFGNMTFSMRYPAQNFICLLSGTISLKDYPIYFQISFSRALAEPQLITPSLSVEFNFNGFSGIPEFPVQISLSEIGQVFVPGFNLPSLFPDPFGAFGMRFEKFKLRLIPPLTKFNLEGISMMFHLDNRVTLVKDWLEVENFTANLQAKISGGLEVSGVINCLVNLGTSSNGFRISASLLIPTPPDKTWTLRLSQGSFASVSLSKVLSLLLGGVDIKSFFPSEILEKVTAFTLENLEINFLTEPQSSVKRISCLLQTNLNDVKLPLKIKIDKIQLYVDAQNPFNAVSRKVDTSLIVWMRVGKASVRSTLYMGSTKYRLETLNLGIQALDLSDLSELVGGTQLLQSLPLGFRQIKSVTLEKLNITFSKPSFDVKEILVVCGLQGLDVGFSFPLPLPDPKNIFRAKLKVSTFELSKKTSWSFSANIETSLDGLPKQIDAMFKELNGVLTVSPSQPVALELKKKIADTTIPMKLAGLDLKLKIKFLNPKLRFPSPDKPETSIDLQISGFDGLNKLLPFKIFADELKMAVLIKQDDERPLMIRLLTLPVLDKIIPCEQIHEGEFKCDFTWICFPDSFVYFHSPSFSYTQDGFQASMDVQGLEKLCVTVTPSFLANFLRRIPLLGNMLTKNFPLWPPPDVVKLLKKLQINTNNIPSGIARFVNPKFPDRVITSITVPQNGPLAFSLKVANGESLNVMNVLNIPRLTGVIFRKFTIGTAFGVPFIDVDIELYFWDLIFLLPLSHLPKTNPLLVNARDMESHIICKDCFFVIVGGLPVPIFAAPFSFRYSSLVDVHAYATVYHKRPGFNNFGMFASFLTGLMKFFTDKDYLLSMHDFGGVNASENVFVVKFSHEQRFTMLRLPKYIGNMQLKLDVPPFDAKTFLIGFMNFFKTLQPKWLLRVVPLRYRLFDSQLNLGPFKLASVKFAASSPKELTENKDMWQHAVQQNGDDAMVIASLNTFLTSIDLTLMARNLFKADLNFTATAGFTDVIKITFDARALVNLQDMSNPLMVKGNCVLHLFRQQFLTGEAIISANEIAVSGDLQFNLFGILKFRGNVASKFSKIGEFYLSSKVELHFIGVKLLNCHLRIRNSVKVTEVKAMASFMGSEIEIQLYRSGLSVRMRARTLVNIDINIDLGEIKVFGTSLGRFKLNTGVSVDIVIAFPGKSSLSASFYFLGIKQNLPSLEFNTKDARPDKIPELVLNLVKKAATNLIKRLFELNPEKYLKAIMDGLFKIGREVGKVVKELLGKGIKLVGNIAKEIGKLVNNFANAAKNVAKLAENAKKALSETAKKARQLAENGYKFAKSTVKVASKTLQDVGKKLGQATEALGNAIMNVDNLKNQVKQAKRLVNAVGKTLANVAKKVFKLVEQIAEEIAKGIRNAVGKVVKVISGWFGKRRIYRRDVLMLDKEHYEREKKKLEREQSNARSKVRSKERELERVQEQEKMRRSARNKIALEWEDADKRFNKAIEEEMRYAADIEDIRNKGKCFTGENNCHPNATCLRSGPHGQSFTCHCKRGWKGDGLSCNMPIKQVSIIGDSPKAVGEPIDFAVFTLSGTNVEYKFSFQNSYSNSSYHVHTFNTPGVHTVWAYTRNPVSNALDSEQVIIQTPVSQLNLTVTGDNSACRPAIFMPTATGTNVSFDITFGDNSSALNVKKTKVHYYKQSGTYKVIVTAKNLVSSVNSSFLVEIKDTPCDMMYCDISGIERSLSNNEYWPGVASRAWALSRSSSKTVNDDPEIWEYLSLLYPLPLVEINITYNKFFEHSSRFIYNISGSSIDIRFVIAGLLGSFLDRRNQLSTKTTEPDMCSPLKNVATKVLSEAVFLLTNKRLYKSWNVNLTRDKYCSYILQTSRMNGAIDGYVLGRMEFDNSLRFSDVLYQYYCPNNSNKISLNYGAKERFTAFVRLINEHFLQHPGNASLQDDFKVALRKITSGSSHKKTHSICLSYFTEYVKMQISGNVTVFDDKCKDWKTCRDCLLFGLKDNCSWCDSTSTCQARANETKCISKQLYQYFPCPSVCYNHLNCSDCESVGGCRWCYHEHGGQCIESNKSGESAPKFCDQTYWYPDRCDFSCVYHKNKVCSNHGKCLSGKCICYGGYYGHNCSKEGCAYRVELKDDVSIIARKFNINSGDLVAANINLKRLTAWGTPNSVITIPIDKEDVRCLNSPQKKVFNPKFPRILRKTKNSANRESFCGLFGSLSANAQAALCMNLSSEVNCQNTSRCAWNPRDPCTGMLIEGCVQLSVSTQLVVSDNQTIFSPISGNTEIGSTFASITGWPNTEWEHYNVTISNFLPLNITSTLAGQKLGKSALKSNPLLPNFVSVLVTYKEKEQDAARFVPPCAPGCFQIFQLGNGVCDVSCNVSDCNFDQGDCDKIEEKRKKIKLLSKAMEDTLTDNTWDTLYKIQQLTGDDILIKRGPISVYSIADEVATEWLAQKPISQGLLYKAIKEQNSLRQLFESFRLRNESKGKIVVGLARKLMDIGASKISAYAKDSNEIQAVDILYSNKENFEKALYLLQLNGNLAFTLINNTNYDSPYYHLEIYQKIRQNFCQDFVHIPIVSQPCDPVNVCSGHGVCKVDGSCFCDAEFIGHDCSMSTCPNNCSSHGTCYKGQCVCEKGWDGKDCSAIKFCTKLCLDIWVGDGKCDPSCDIPECKYDNGDCVDVCVCPKAWLGDKSCDVTCNTSVCRYDNGDCLKNIKHCNVGCNPEMVGDGYCDKECNVELCSFDNGDCKLGGKCDCPQPLQGNGECNDECNSELCMFDFGDCVVGKNVDLFSCPNDCPPSMVGNGFCDLVCNSSSCDFDGGDCVQALHGTSVCSSGCLASFRGDGQCDSICNVIDCNFDNNDCPKPITTTCSPGCSLTMVGDGKCQQQCFVHECSYDGKDCECASGCANSSIGDGVCDSQCLVAACEYDGDDCTCPPKQCPRKLIGNGVCDLQCNTLACEFDGGDCNCAPGCPVASINDGWCDKECDTRACDFDGLDCGGCQSDAHLRLCDPNAYCVVVNDSLPYLQCRCKTSYYGDGFSCIKRGKCFKTRDVCSPQALCLNISGTFECYCKNGLKGNGIFCENINECATNTHNCSENAICVDTPGSYICRCKSGWSGNGFNCTDIDECKDKVSSHKCCGNEECINFEGSYNCTCKEGWRENNVTDELRSPSKCFMKVNNSYFINENCIDIDECAENLDNCSKVGDVANAKCVNSAGGFTCTCNDGWEGNGWFCTDVNECQLNNSCGEHQVCKNTLGSFTCSCKKGWVFNATGTGQCDDLDECSLGMNTCHEFATCINTNGSYQCRCKEGFDDDGRMCLKYKCFNSTSQFGEANTFNSSTLCLCVGGYSNTGRDCVDTNECETANFKCPDFSPVCFNTVGGYECKCDVDGNKTCESFNPCQAVNNSCHANMTCVVSGLEHYCVCPEGYVENPDGDGCIDRNECLAPDIYKCPQDAHCVNVPGSYDCKCRKGYLESGSTCFEIDECKGLLSFSISGHLQECRPGVCSSVQSCVFPETNESRHDNSSLVCSCDQANTKRLECIYATTKVVNSGKTDNVSTLLLLSWETMFNATELNGVAPAILRHNCSLSNSTCRNTPGSYKCFCNQGFKSNDSGRHCYDEDECVRNDSCDPNALCINTIGSFICKCKNGFSGDGRKVCNDKNECELNIHNCHENASCINTFGNFACKCKDGYQGNGTFCEDLNECLNSTLNWCHPRAQCFNYIGGYRCECRSGYQGDGLRCRDIDECVNKTQLCGDNALCYNTPGSYTCKCRRGWTGDGQNCSNVDECSLGLHQCVEHSHCRDYAGGYICECERGWTRQWFEPYGRCSKCDSSLLCSDHGRCLRDGTCDCLVYYGGQSCSVCKPEVRCSGHGSCDFNGTCRCEPGWTRQPLDCSICVPEKVCNGHGECNYDLRTYTNRSCYCDSGYTGDNCSKACPAIDGNVCGIHGDCSQDPSGPSPCTCHIGYQWDNSKSTCVDTNECSTQMHGCETPAICLNTDGSYRCQCPSLVGWSFDGQRCNDTDECQYDDVCDVHATCQNYPGGFRCSCSVGWRGNGEHPVCNDIDECGEGSHKCPAVSKCINTLGSYYCVCNQGYEKVSQFQCDEINECTRGIHGCDPHSTCVNSPGSWKCRCNNGWYPESANDRLPTCKDVNECVDKPNACPSQSTCVNTAGSYHCSCLRGWVNQGPHTCVDVNECSTSPCPSNSRCVNNQGSYACHCNSGFDPRPPVSASSCSDINECTRGLSSCPIFSHCVNLIGSYRCDCNRCYHSSGGGCTANCRTEVRSYTYYTTGYYNSYYTTSCGFLGLSRCRRSRSRSRRQSNTGYRTVHIAVLSGASCPCS